jgi:hypothetical protein
MPTTTAARPAPVIRRRADDPRNHVAYALAAELRAVEDGHHAWAQPDGTILVKAESTRAAVPEPPTAAPRLPGIEAEPPTRYRVQVEGVEDGLVMLSCTCRSGFHRTHLPVPCKHAALAARRLERESLLRWDGGWRARHPLPTVGADLPEPLRRFRRSVLTMLHRPALLAERAA